MKSGDRMQEFTLNDLVTREKMNRIARVIGPNSAAQKCLDREEELGKACSFFSKDGVMYAIPTEDLEFANKK